MDDSAQYLLVLAPVMVFVLGSYWVFSLTYTYLYLRDREPHLAYWGGSYLAFSVSSIALCVFLTLEVPAWLRPLLLGFGAGSLMVAALALLLGADAYLGRRGHRVFVPLAVVSALAAVVLQAIGMPAPVVFGVPGVVLSSAYAYTGYALLWHSKERGLGAAMAGGAACLQALHGLTFPVALTSATALGVGTAVSVVFVVAMGMGLLLLHVDRAKNQAAESRSQYERLVERAAVGICRTTAAGQILAANPEFVAMLGYDSIDDVLALNMAHDVYASDNSAQ